MLADPGEHHRAQPVSQGAADVVLRALEVPVEVDPDAELHHPLPPALASRTARMSRVSLLVGHDMGPRVTLWTTRTPGLCWPVPCESAVQGFRCRGEWVRNRS